MKNQITGTEAELLDHAATEGPFAKATIYLKQSDPGWLQGAVSLGGDSLAGARNVGIISSYQLL